MEFSLPPSVNWYSFQSLDVSSHGVVAYASMRECVITKLSIDKGTYVYDFLQLCIYKAYVHILILLSLK